MSLSQRIKVAEVITRLDWGGSPDIVRIICSYLKPELYDIRLITGPTRYPSLKTREFLEKFKSNIVVISQLKREINPINDLIALLKLYLLFRQERFDIVHTHTAKAGVLARVAAHLSGRPVILHTPHGHNFYGYFGPLFSKIIIAIERFVVRFTNKIIVLTELEKKDFIRFKVSSPDKIILIHQGLELDRYTQANKDKVKIKKALGIQPEEDVVGLICRLEPIKGPGYFVEAAKEVIEESPQTKFIVVGEGSLHKRLMKQVEDLRLKDRFIFTGWREDIPEITSILDILVLPSLNEAVGIVLIEAQAQGVPVVATNVGGIPEIVKDNQTGILVPAGDSRALAQAINYLLKNEENRKNMGQAGKDWVKDRFSADEMAKRISDLYKELISNREGTLLRLAQEGSLDWRKKRP